jgi:hypothetical protein
LIWWQDRNNENFFNSNISCNYFCIIFPLVLFLNTSFYLFFPISLFFTMLENQIATVVIKNQKGPLHENFNLYFFANYPHISYCYIQTWCRRLVITQSLVASEKKVSLVTLQGITI